MLPLTHLIQSLFSFTAKPDDTFVCIALLATCTASVWTQQVSHITKLHKGQELISEPGLTQSSHDIMNCTLLGGMCSNCSSERGPEDQENTSGRGELWHPRHVRISPEEHFQALNWLRQRLDSVLYLSNYITFKTAGVILKKKSSMIHFKIITYVPSGEL